MKIFLNKWVLTLALAFVAQALLAQTQTLRGTVLDKQAETPLIGATVQLLGAAGETLGGATTDPDGAFVLREVPVGRQVLRVTYLGYESTTVPNILVTAGKEVLLDIRLEESFSNIGEVVVVGKVNKDKPMNELATVSARVGTARPVTANSEPE